MLFFYNLSIRLYSLLIQFAGLKSSKARQFIKGRENIFERIEQAVSRGQQHIWFHFASLGEFEQGRPVLEKIRQHYPESKIVVTFFSPSGYEVRKNTPLADHVFYLPEDTQENAARFIRLINPSLAIFTKYEYWYYYFQELKDQHVPLYIISGIFRKSQPFFRWYGGLHRKMLKCVTYFFVQNEESRLLLEELNIRNAIVSGDTRFDRVYENARNPKQLTEIENFCGDTPVFIAGSTWLPDEKLLAALVNRLPGWKFIIAPHEIGEGRIKEIEELFPESIRFSNLNSRPSGGAQASFPNTLIIDNIGMLSSLYQYGDIAYIGGGFGAGIHNTLEAAAFSLPVIFGPNYQKFQEARNLLQIEAAFPISEPDDLKSVAEKLKDENFRLECGRKARQYVGENTGATDTIMKYITNPSHSKRI